MKRSLSKNDQIGDGVDPPKTKPRHAIFYKENAILTTRDHCDKHIKRKIKNEVFPDNEIKFHPAAPLIGNGEGFEMMDEFSDIRNRLKHLEDSREEDLKNHNRTKDEVASLKKEMGQVKEHLHRFEEHLHRFEERWYLIRAHELDHDVYVDPPDTYARAIAKNRRNELIHGGDILYDLRTVDFIQKEEPRRFKYVSQGFHDWYEISACHEASIKNAPKEIIDTFNKRANLKGLLAWEGDERTDKLLKICTSILDKWFKHIQEKGVYPRGEIKKEYDGLIELYYRKPHKDNKGN